MRERSCKRVFIVEDDVDLRSSLVFQLGSEGLHVRAFESAEAFLAKFKAEDEGCVAIDVNLPGISGLVLLERLSRLASRFVPVIMTGRGDVSMAVRAMRAGADDFIEKPFSASVFRRSILNALAMAEHRLPMQRDTHDAVTKFESLSEREREVFAGLVDGRQGKQIAFELGISPRTIEIHRARIMAKLDASSFSDLLRMGMMLELRRRLEPPPVSWSIAAAQVHQKHEV